MLWMILNEDEAARMLRLSTRTLQRKRLTGDGPPFIRLTERRIGYARETLESWIEQRQATSTTDRGGRAA